MPLVTMRQLLDEAAAGGYGVAAFNVKYICMQRMQELGMAGHAGDYEPMSLGEMAARYASGVRTAA